MHIAFVGHVCVDKNVVHGQTETLYGGGVVHGSITARRLGAQATVLTKCAAAARPGFEYLTAADVHLVCLPSDSTTSIRNFYPTENPDDRESHLISSAAAFCEEDLTVVLSLHPEVIHINPLWFGEFPPELLAHLRPRVSWLAADAQGFLRVAGPDGRLSHQDFADKRKALSCLDLFKVDAKEALILTGEPEPSEAARAIHALGAKLVLLTHRSGVCVFDGHAFHQAPFTGFTLEGRTGRGDTCTAAFLVARGRGMGLATAAAFAADITSRKMMYRGPYRG
jgi:sugar/nucleoside kinase (ribokinase family)